MRNIDSEKKFSFLASANITIIIRKMTFLKLVFVLSLAAFPMKAISQPDCFTNCDATGDIPFTIQTNDTDMRWCIECDGPWFRTTQLLEIRANKLNYPCTFYAANFTTFSPIGKWTCQLQPYLGEGNCQCSSNVSDETTFCLVRGAPYETPHVVFDIEKDVRLKVNMPLAIGNCPDSLSGFLGDNAKQEKSKPDTDEFSFNGTDGAEVTLRLEANPQEGNNGGEASLGISGNSLNESTSGAPPLELEVTLPGDGQYSIIVEQPKKSAERFRGSYILSVTPGIGSIDLIEPTINVEK
ncbi:MAG: hypothetical protein WBD99_12865 [Thermodesulfobacteriota bacterium]